MTAQGVARRRHDVQAVGEGHVAALHLEFAQQPPDAEQHAARIVPDHEHRRTARSLPDTKAKTLGVRAAGARTQLRRKRSRELRERGHRPERDHRDAGVRPHRRFGPTKVRPLLRLLDQHPHGFLLRSGQSGGCQHDGPAEIERTGGQRRREDNEQAKELRCHATVDWGDDGRPAEDGQP